MRAVRNGDVARLGTLFERHHGSVFDFLCRMTGNRTVAEDLTQDVFVRILKYRATFRDEGRFETWSREEAPTRRWWSGPRRRRARHRSPFRQEAYRYTEPRHVPS